MNAIPSRPGASLDLSDRVARAIGKRTISLEPLSGGMIDSIYRARFESGPDLVIKHNPAADARLDIEAIMLGHLRDAEVIHVPEVVFADRDLLIQELIEGNHIDASAHADLGQRLAALHAVTSPRAGLGMSTLNGSLLIPSPWTDSWIEFYRKHRLCFAADAARRRGKLAAEFHDRVMRLAERLDDLLIEPSSYSLLHGDVWSANVLAQDGIVTGFIDPSTCYGDPELELAYMSLFGGFGDADGPAFRAYHALRPIALEFWTTRRFIYAIYPALMHVLYFGERYIPLLDNLLNQSRV